MTAATYPGTVTPLRGLSPFAESERDVLFGRDRERDELARMVTNDGFRAGLLYGESGVGKTSLLRAGLAPHLRDHGVVALFCDDIYHPAESFARAVQQASGMAPNDGEQPMMYLARVVSQALEGQLYLFILDEVDRALATGDERIIADLGDLFARVVTRSGGRARFLFSCASSHVHLFGLLEKRTGSLFPPSSRYQLERFQPADASMVLDRTLALAGVPADQQLAGSVVDALARDGAILAADLQIAALAIRELGLTKVEQVGRIGGAGQLERLWLEGVASSTGNEKVALRLLAELAVPRGGAYPPEWAAARAGIDPAVAGPTMASLAQFGVVHQVQVPGQAEPCYELAHEILAPRVREVAAPARVSARRAFELLGSKAAEGRRLSLREWRDLRRDKITPLTPMEQAVIHRTKRFFTIIAAACAAVPLIIIILCWISLAGSYYVATARPGGGSAEHVVVRAGKPSLSGFFWLPGSPSYGSIIADTGFTRPMLSEDGWKKARSGDLGGSQDSGYVDRVLAILDPSLRQLIEYAATGKPAALNQLESSAKTPVEIVNVLEKLKPIARGGEKEVAYIEKLLGNNSPAVRNAALGVAEDATRRGVDSYHDTLATQLASPDDEQRRLAFSAVQSLSQATARKLFERALELEPEAAPRRELLAEVTAGAASATPSADTAKSVLVNRDVGASTREKARELLRRAFASDPNGATLAAAELAGDPKAPVEDRVLALNLMSDLAPDSAYADALIYVKAARRAKDEEVRAAALPLFAKMAPKQAAGDLALMLDDKKLSTTMREAMTLAWGEIAKTKDKAAQGALETLIKDNSSTIRAAAARAYGNTGRVSQDTLNKMVKKEGLTVATGAAYGLANSSEQGGSTGNAVYGISQLWKRKGRSRRVAAEVYARMARTKSGARSVYSYLVSAVRSKDDPALHPIGADGLCNGLAAGYRSAEVALARAASDDSVEVRRIVINCVSDHPDHDKTATAVASKLAEDPSVNVRTEAARVLAKLAASDKPPSSVGKALTEMVGDSSRDVRVIALRALAGMGSAAPDKAAAALVKAFDGADAGEKLELLKAARAIGVSDLVPIAIADPSPAVRTSAVNTAIATGASVSAVINAALTDDDPTVRRSALEQLASHAKQLDQAEMDRALGLAVEDPDPGIAAVALTTYARIGKAERVATMLADQLGSRSERERARVAAACMGLVARGDAKKAVELLEPLLRDPSHDVRAAALEPLAAAYAVTNSPDQLAKMLRGSERNAMRRLVATAAFVMLSRTSAGAQAAKAALSELSDGRGQLTKQFARIGRGLVDSNADGIAFLRNLVP